MDKSWLRGAAFFSSVSLAAMLVVRASGGCSSDRDAGTGTVTPEPTVTASGAAAAGTAASAASPGAVAPTASSEVAPEPRGEFGGTGKSGPVYRTRSNQAPQQQAPGTADGPR